MSAATQEQFDDIVPGGTRTAQGMASFADKIPTTQSTRTSSRKPRNGVAKRRRQNRPGSFSDTGLSESVRTFHFFGQLKADYRD
jgi:hypothetical protein